MRNDKLGKRRGSHLHEILLHAEILDDELLPLGRVLSHEEGQEFVGAVEVMEVDRGEPDVLADEVLELAGGDFAQALEAGDLVIRSEFTAALPQEWHAIAREVRIACHQRHGFDHRLCDEQAIKWVAMVMLQSAHGGKVGDADRQKGQAAFGDGRRKERLELPRQCELIEGDLDREFPETGHTHMGGSARFLDPLARRGGQARVGLEEPKCCVGVQQQAHSMYSRNSSSGSSKSGAIQNPGRPIHTPAFARGGPSAAGSMVAVIRIFR